MSPHPTDRPPHPGRRSWHARAVVTGAGSGIGRAFALELARRGGQVVCADVVGDRAADTAELLAAQGAAALPVTCDVTSLDEVRALATAAEDWWGAPPTLVVNNAGVGAGGRPVGEIDIDDWRWVLGVNLWGVVHGCHVFAPVLRGRGGEGGIINVASAAAFAAAPLMGPYNVSKAGVLALSETLAAELAGTGVHVSVLMPTFVATNIIRDGRASGPAAEQGARMMERARLSPDDVVRRTLDAHDRGRLHVVPQADARLIWRLKRHAPRLYTRAAGWGLRLVARRDAVR